MLAYVLLRISASFPPSAFESLAVLTQGMIAKTSRETAGVSAVTWSGGIRGIDRLRMTGHRNPKSIMPPTLLLAPAGVLIAASRVSNHFGL